MFSVYFPIAELPLNVLILLLMGGGVGFLSGLFGVGGGFLLTPLLIFYGVPPAVAVSTQAPQIVASSMSGMLAYWRRGGVDWQMGAVMAAGGLVGSVFGVEVFAWLRAVGQIDLVIGLAFVILLGGIGLLMGRESLITFLRNKNGQAQVRRKLHKHWWVHDWPFKMRFRASRLYISVIPPVLIGFVIGVLVAIMGIGGGFILVPAMIFLLGMPTVMAVGTSLFQIIIVTGAVTLLHATANYTVDAMLALILALGGVVGAQWGARAALGLKAEHVRGLFAGLVLAVAAKVAYDLAASPDDIYSVTRPIIALQ